MQDSGRLLVCSSVTCSALGGEAVLLEVEDLCRENPNIVAGCAQRCIAPQQCKRGPNAMWMRGSTREVFTALKNEEQVRGMVSHCLQHSGGITVPPPVQERALKKFRAIRELVEDRPSSSVELLNELLVDEADEELRVRLMRHRVNAASKVGGNAAIAIGLQDTREIVKSNPEDMATLFKQAKLLENSGRFDEAIGVYIQVADRFTVGSAADTKMSMEVEQRITALKERKARQQLKRTPGAEVVPTPSQDMGTIGTFEVALQDTQEVLAKDPTDLSTMLRQASLLEKAGQLDGALTAYESILRLGEKGKLVQWNRRVRDEVQTKIEQLQMYDSCGSRRLRSGAGCLGGCFFGGC